MKWMGNEGKTTKLYNLTYSNKFSLDEAFLHSAHNEN